MGSFLFAVGGVLVAFFLLFTALLAGGNAWQHSLDATACTTFGAQSNRQVKFVDYSWGNWDCLTPSSDGTNRWISAHLLRENTGK